MRILIDTNIIIPLEDSSTILLDSLGQLIKLSSEHSHQILIHPRSTEDINRDKLEPRRLSMLSRLEKYPVLEDTQQFTEEELLRYSIRNRDANDSVDNDILSATYNNAVHWLITEDRRIHRNATSLGIGGNVYYVQQAVDALNRLHPQARQIFHPNLKNISLHQTKISDPFYDSLRLDYNGFDKWFKTICAEGRMAWGNFTEDKKLNAILIYKEEQSECITDDHRTLPGKVLKISTFKVGEQVRGRKIGELLFKSVFEYAVINKFTYVYLTVHPTKHEFLQDLCRDLGFSEYGTDVKGRDKVLIKPIGYQEGEILKKPFEFYRRYSPALRCSGINKYIIPIQKRYHEILFPDNQIQHSLFSQEEPAGNTIKKAYLSHAQLNHMNPGDLILFYRSGDWQELTTLAIVERFFISDDSDEVARDVAKRTVYSLAEITSMTEKKTKVILFRQVMHFENKVSFQWMKDNDIVRGSIQSITRISDTSFERIMDAKDSKNCIDLH